MDEVKFRDLVDSMRSAQRSYFRTRNSADLMLSKSLESQVDAELERWRRRGTELFPASLDARAT